MQLYHTVFVAGSDFSSFQCKLRISPANDLELSQIQCETVTKEIKSINFHLYRKGLAHFETTEAQIHPYLHSKLFLSLVAFEMDRVLWVAQKGFKSILAK